MEDLIFYQWRRLCQFLPSVKQPKLHGQSTGKIIDDPQGGDDERPAQAQWRLRASSLHFHVAYRMLYPNGSGAGLQLTEEALSLIDTEAMASLWADRGRIHRPRSDPQAQGRLNLSRFDWGSAVLINQWIHRLSGASGTIAGNPWRRKTPMLFLDNSNLVKFLAVLGNTWHAQAGCLQSKFLLPEVRDLQEAMMRERMESLSEQSTSLGPTPLKLKSAASKELPVMIPIEALPRPENP